MTTNPYIEFLQNNGVSTDEWNGGTGQFALESTLAIEAIDILKNMNVGILGGDMYYMEVGKIHYGYASWSTNSSHLNINGRLDVDLAAEMARKYIRTFPNIYNHPVVFFQFVLES
jgi:hypothetical protein